MIDYSLKPCPFCGNPAEIVPCEPPEWFSGAKHVVIRCSSETCLMHYHKSSILRATVEDYCNTLDTTKAEWNTRKKKNKAMFKDKPQKDWSENK